MGKGHVRGRTHEREEGFCKRVGTKRGHIRGKDHPSEEGHMAWNGEELHNGKDHVKGEGIIKGGTT